MIQICEGLEYAHEKGVVHRDVKPGNIFVLRNGQVKILDFGIAQIAAAETGLTRAGLIVGTLQYMAPERARGQGGHASDIFSVGAVFYELLANRAPFSGEDPIEILDKLRTENPPRLSEVDPSLPAELEAIIERALQKDPTRRFANLGQMRAELQTLRRKRSEDTERLRLDVQGPAPPAPRAEDSARGAAGRALGRRDRLRRRRARAARHARERRPRHDDTDRPSQRAPGACGCAQAGARRRPAGDRGRRLRPGGPRARSRRQRDAGARARGGKPARSAAPGRGAAPGSRAARGVREGGERGLRRRGLRALPRDARVGRRARCAGWRASRGRTAAGAPRRPRWPAIRKRRRRASRRIARRVNRPGECASAPRKRGGPPNRPKPSWTSRVCGIRRRRSWPRRERLLRRKRTRPPNSISTTPASSTSERRRPLVRRGRPLVRPRPPRPAGSICLSRR